MPANGRMETVDLTAGGASDIVFGVRASAPEGAPAGDELVLRSATAGAVDRGGPVRRVRLPERRVRPRRGHAPRRSAAHNQLRVAIEIEGAPAADGEWRFEDFEVGGESRASDCPADLAPPAGVLDLADINAFVTGFTGSQPIADLAEPFGVFDLADVGAFVGSFVAGCP
jgi:hypothetical protein